LVQLSPKLQNVVWFRFGLKSVKLNVHKMWENSDNDKKIEKDDTENGV
jgi:hypothetical protein